MLHEYYEWLKEHPEATEEEKEEMLTKCKNRLKAWDILINMLLAYR